MASFDFQPPPTYALPILVDEKTGVAQFNPIWLKWFLDLAQVLSSVGAGGGGVDHNLLTNLQGGQATQYYHLTAGEELDLTDGGDTNLHFHSADRAASIHEGPQGDEGPIGPPGSPGATGATGAAGSPGADGLVGYTIRGDPGEDGADGIPLPGPQGSAGADGATGAQGVPGTDGYTIRGEDGEVGSEGIPGAAAPFDLWADLTDGSETTLHTHAATGVTNFHALIAAHVDARL